MLHGTSHARGSYMQSHYIQHNNSSIHYRVFGNGEKLLFCFHGYGRESYTFSILSRPLGKQYTIIALDIPFHGLTRWKDDLVVEPKALAGIMQQLAEEINPQANHFSLLGFSMGGRIALYLTQLLQSQIDKLILIAPDGINFNFWRWLASETWIGHQLLSYTIHHPGWINWIVNKAERWHVIHRNLADFIRYYIHDNEQRIILYNRWISMRRFSPNLTLIKRLLKQNHTPVRMMFGKYDRVIPAAGGKKFCKGIEDLCQLHIVEAGHNLLTEAQVSKLVELINE